MPLYEYDCLMTGKRMEVLRVYTDRRFCPCGCGAPRVISAPARTAFRWGDTQWSGRYDRGLGTTIRDEKHRKELMKRRGLRELQPGEVEREIASAEKRDAEHDANVANFNKHRAETGDVGLALARTFPADKILAEAND